MECSSLPEMDMTEWGEVLLGKLQGQRYPLGAAIELTERCNLSCLHCYINQPAGDRQVKASEMTTEQVIDILDQITDAGTLFLTLTGGEPLLRPDFAEIYRYAKYRGLLITLFTNATMMTPQIADLLAELPPISIETTLYGATPETYERVTRVPGSYARCRRGIDLMLERGLPLSLKSFLITVNRDELDGMKAIADQAGVKFRFDGLVFPRYDGSQEPLKYRLSIQELIDLDKEDPERRQELVKLLNGNSGEAVRDEYVYNCGAGLRSFAIHSDGQMTLCQMIRRPAFDLKTVRFKEAWERLSAILQVKRVQDNACRTCTLGSFCVQCPSWSQMVHGDDETPVDFVCELAHMHFEQIKQN